jgi:hypothetical protein
LVLVNEQDAMGACTVFPLSVNGNKIYATNILTLYGVLIRSQMPPAAPAIPPKRLLPSKEASLFREVLNLYESKQLKKAQKTSDQILKKFPEHGGTIGVLII